MRKAASQGACGIRNGLYSMERRRPASKIVPCCWAPTQLRPVSSWTWPTELLLQGTRRRRRKPFLLDFSLRDGNFAAKDPRKETHRADTTTPPCRTEATTEILEQHRRRFQARYSQLGSEQATSELNAILRLWLDCWRDQKQQGTPEKACLFGPSELFQWIKGMPQLHPNLATYQTLLDGVVSAKGQQRQLQRSAKFAESLLKLMLDIFFNKTQGDRTDITSNGSDSSAESKQVDQSSAVANIDAQEVIDLTYAFHKVMTLYCQANYVAAAERLLRELEQLNDTGGNNCIPLTVDSYTIVLSGWAKRGAPREAEYVLNGMLNRSSRAKKQDRIIMPTKNNFESCLGAWVMASTSVSGQRAELLLLKMQELHEKKFDAKPCVKSFSKVISAWVNSKHQEATIRADAILTMMNEIDWSDETDMTSFHKTLADIYLQVMKLWSSYSKPNAPEKCSQLLLQLNANTGFQHVKSVTVQRLYAALITAWARSGRKNIIASRVQEIFAEMNAQRRTGGVFATNDNLSFVWDSAVYHALLLAYAQAGDGTKAEAMLKSMLQEYLEHHSSGVENSNSNTPTKVDTKCFNLVLLAWSKSSEPDATMRAEDLFLQMLQLRNRDHVDVRPDVVSYNAVLAAFSGTNDRLRARRGYDYFRQLTNTKDPTCRPTTVSYTLAIRVWSRLPTLEALERVQFLLDEMKTGDRSVRPDATTYKAFLSVLKKCTFLSADERTRRMEDIQREWDKLGSHRC